MPIAKGSMRPRPSLPPDLYSDEYFLTSCEGHAEFAESHGERLSRRLNAALAAAAIMPQMRVLDVGCGRGEVLWHCAQLGADAYGVDYAPAAVRLAGRLLAANQPAAGSIGVVRADAKHLPFPDAYFDRVLMFDVVEHLYPWELEECLAEAWRVLRRPDAAAGRRGGMLVAHTAPNAWYDRYAYPVVRLVRRLMGQGAHYPRDPRALNVSANVHVHVNEQSILSLRRALSRAGFGRVKVWLDSPPQNRREHWLLAAARRILFGVPPFRYFFEREVFAVGERL